MSLIATEAAARAALRRLFEAGVGAADPRRVLARHLPERPTGRVIVLGAGKSAAVMAAAVEEAWPDLPLSGLVVTRYGHSYPTQRIAVVEASHPIPDEAGAQAAARLLAMAQAARAEDLVLVLISGGGSALTTLPAPGLTLADLIAVNEALLASGATIEEMNCLRKHLSAFAGGRLAIAAYPARVVTLAISDVPGDDPAVIASGPTVPDPTTFAQAREIIAHYRLAVPAAVVAHLTAEREETPKPGDPRFHNCAYRLIATPAMALQAMATEARNLGLRPLLLGDALEGEARVLGTVLAGIAKSVARHGRPVEAPCVLLSGGEATVTLPPGVSGRGGRNTECLLGLALALRGLPHVFALAADSDGIDGRSDAAGAIITPTTLARARAAGLDPRAMLAAHDSYGLFAVLGDLLITGPTLTNVNDLRAVIVTAAA